jgi:hypothetical protein
MELRKSYSHQKQLYQQYHKLTSTLLRHMYNDITTINLNKYDGRISG